MKFLRYAVVYVICPDPSSRVGFTEGSGNQTRTNHTGSYSPVVVTEMQYCYHLIIVLAEQSHYCEHLHTIW